MVKVVIEYCTHVCILVYVYNVFVQNKIQFMICMICSCVVWVQWYNTVDIVSMYHSIEFYRSPKTNRRPAGAHFQSRLSAQEGGMDGSRRRSTHRNSCVSER